jgi:hypothetical protein
MIAAAVGSLSRYSQSPDVADQVSMARFKPSPEISPRLLSAWLSGLPARLFVGKQVIMIPDFCWTVPTSLASNRRLYGGQQRTGQPE